MKTKILDFLSTRLLLFTLSPFLLFSLSPLLLFSQSVPDTSILNLRAPDTFRAVMITTKGEITIEACREWSPKGVDRLYQLITSGFYSDMRPTFDPATVY